MRLISIFILLAIICPPITGQAQIEQTPFNVTYVVTTPYLSPEDRNVGIEFTLQNNQKISLDNIRIYLFLREPFSASIAPNNKIGEISFPGYLIGNGGSEYTSNFFLAPGSALKTVFKIDVNRSAKYGTYELPYSIHYDQSKEYNGKIALAIKGDTLVEIKNVSVSSNNSQVEPGEFFKISISFENAGDNDIKWLKLKLVPTDSALLPLRSDSEQVFKDLAHGAIEEFDFWFSLEKDAAIKNYPIDLILTYMDERGTEYNETKQIGIVASGKGNLDIAKKITEPASIKQGEQFTLTLKIENTGTGNAKSVIAKLGPQLEGDTIAYLGEIKRDDYSNAVFTLESTTSGKKQVILNLTYEDGFGKHEIQKELILVIASSDQNNMFPFAAGIFMLGTVLYFWKGRKN